jgi:two-component sensor histidine kinase
MAKIVEDTLVIKFSRIVKENDSDPDPAITAENAMALEQVAQELVGNSVIVEVTWDGN